MMAPNIFLHGTGPGKKTSIALLHASARHLAGPMPMTRLYRFTSVLGFFKRCYVDITGRCQGERNFPQLWESKIPHPVMLQLTAFHSTLWEITRN
jgi:hypothetical protein